MLEELNIENIALIEKASLHFSAGLNVLTGETGAGKSILLGALGLLLGDRADRSLIRKGADEAVVSAVLSPVPRKELDQWYQQYDITPDPNGLILRRTLKDNGRSNIYIQSQPVTLQALKDLSILLFDIHGQHQHQSLFVIENHRRLLDRFGNLEARVRTLNHNFKEVSKLRDQLQSWEEKAEIRQREKELAGYALEEIEAAELKPGEEEQWLSLLKKMEQKEQLLEKVNHFQREMDGEQGVLSTLKTLQSILGNLTDLNPATPALAERFDNSYYELEDITETLQGWMDSFDFSLEEQQKAEDRLAIIQRLEHKYAPDIAGLIEHAAQCRELLSSEEQSQKEYDQAKSRKTELEKRIISDAQEISAARAAVGKELETMVEANLRELGMSSAEFKISLSGRKNQEGMSVCGPFGSDQVEFLFCANKGGDLKPLKAVASGGELSRIMLALKTAFAGADQIETLIFDEIDTGIGGEVALSIGNHFRKLSSDKQIFCITHLASIASFADTHIRVLKKEAQDSTKTEVINLKKEDRVEEIARMLAGDRLGELSLSHARELLTQNSPLN